MSGRLMILTASGGCIIENDGSRRVVKLSDKFVRSHEGKNQANYDCSHGLCAFPLSRFDTIDRKGDTRGVLKNVYSDNLLGVNLGSGFPTNNFASPKHFSHRYPLSLKARFGRSCRAFVNAWKASGPARLTKQLFDDLNRRST